MQIRFLATTLSGSDHGQVIYTRASVTKQYNLVLLQAVGLASLQLCSTDISGISAYRLMALKGKHPTNAAAGICSVDHLYLHPLTPYTECLANVVHLCRSIQVRQWNVRSQSVPVEESLSVL